MPQARKASRDRHGRGLRHPLSGGFYHLARGRSDDLTEILGSTCEYLRSLWPDELANLTWRIMDAPHIGPLSREVRRFSVRKEVTTVTFYRLPIMRLSLRAANPIDERLRIEHYAFLAIAELLGKEPWQLLPGTTDE
jgi:hypothetical protein